MLVTRTELAKALNLTKGRISQLEKARVLRPTRAGKFDLEKAQEQYLAHLAARGDQRAETGNSSVTQIAKVQLERQETKLEYERTQMELLKLRTQVQRGILVNHKTVRQTAALQVFGAGRRIWMALPLQFIHQFAKSQDEVIAMDLALSRIMESCFSAVNHRDIGREAARVVKNAERVLSAIDSGDPALPTLARKFCQEIVDSFSCIKPDWPAKLGLRFLVRGEPHPLGDAGEPDSSEELEEQKCETFCGNCTGDLCAHSALGVIDEPQSASCGRDSRPRKNKSNITRS